MKSVHYMVFYAFTGIQLEKNFFPVRKIFFSNWLMNAVAKILVKQFQFLLFTSVVLFVRLSYSDLLSFR